jgi:transposase
MDEARVVRPDRRQLRWDMVDLDGLLPAEHRARIVWSFAEGLDLSQLYDQVKSRVGEAGRPATDPAVLMALWLYATVEGVGSARALERLAGSDIAYRWLAPAATARPPIDCSSTQATPRANTSLRWPLMGRVR